MSVIWILARASGRRRAKALEEALAGRARVVSLGPAGDPPPHLELPPQGGLEPALESCPPELRPAACVCLEAGASRELDCLPCPVVGWGGGWGPEGELPADPGAAAAELLRRAGEGFRPAWMERVQVNLPLADLWGPYRELARSLPLNLELGLDARALDGMGDAELARLRGWLAGRRLTAHLPFMGLVPGSADPQVAELAGRRLRQGAEMALALGCIQAVAHLGFDHRYSYDPQDYARRAAEQLAPVARRLAEGRVRLVLENVFEAEPGPLLAAREAIVEAAGVEVGFCLDVGHALAFSRTGLAAWWEALAPHLGELHLHDNLGEGDLHLPPGWGRVDWAFLGRALGGLEEEPVLTLEPHREGHLWAGLRALGRLWSWGEGCGT